MKGDKKRLGIIYGRILKTLGNKNIVGGILIGMFISFFMLMAFIL